MIAFTPQNLVLYLVENGIITNTALFRRSLATTKSNTLDPIWMFYECGLQHYLIQQVSEEQRYGALRSFSEAWKNASEPQQLAHSKRFYKELTRLSNGSANLSRSTKADINCATSALAEIVDAHPAPLSLFPKSNVHDSIPDNYNADSNESRGPVEAIDIRVDRERGSWINRPWTPSHTAQRSRRSRYSSSSRFTSAQQSARSSASIGAYSPTASSAFHSAASSASSVSTWTSSRKAKEHCAAEWRRRQDEIAKLYIEQNLTLKQVQAIMRMEGFDATQRQYKRKFDEWQLKKNLTEEDKLIIIAKKHQRKVSGKQTIFAINGKPIGDLMLSKLLKGVQTNSADLLGDRRTPPQITYFTPPESDAIDAVLGPYSTAGLDKEIPLNNSPKDSQMTGEDETVPNRHNTNLFDELDFATIVDAATGTRPAAITDPLPATFTLPQEAWGTQTGMPEVIENPIPVHKGVGDPAYLDFNFEELFATEEPFGNGFWDSQFGNADDKNSNWLDVPANIPEESE